MVIVDALAHDGGEVFPFGLLPDQLVQVVFVGAVVRSIARLPVVNVVRINGLVLRFATLKLVLGDAQLVNVLKKIRGKLSPTLLKLHHFKCSM